MTVIYRVRYCTNFKNGKKFISLFVLWVRCKLFVSNAHKYPEKSYKTYKTDIEALPLERLLAPNGS